MDEDDRGHRYGNFPNYYAFHPPDIRMRVLERCNFVDHIRNGISLSSSDEKDDDENDDDETDDDDVAIAPPARKRTRRRRRRRHDDGVVYVCDLGCNMGDMTMAMAYSLVAKNGVEEGEDDDEEGGGKEECAIRDDGDVDGNEDVGDDGYDVGAVATSAVDDADGMGRSIFERSSRRRRRRTTNDDRETKHGNIIAVKCLGLDIDPTLIERATSKFSPDSPPTITTAAAPTAAATATATTGPHRVGRSSAMAIFRVCDLSSEMDHNCACSCFLGCGRSSDGVGDGDGAGGIPRGDDNDDNGRSCSSVTNTNTNTNTTMPSSMPRPLFHLTTIFSATMWIHVHAGDDGLREFLKRACGWTKMYLLIEPQPSGW